jgi:hypothetical protein
MKNQITLGSVTIVARPNTRKKIEFHVPTGMNGEAFVSFKKEHSAEIEAFRASVEGASESSTVEGDRLRRH